MGDRSADVVVPAVDNAEPGGDPAIAAAEEKDLLCPICMQIIQDAFLTSCGHSFCYMCIVTHLHNKSDCPCCAHFLTPSQLFPNFLLNKLIVIRFLCTTFVAIEEDICPTTLKNCISCRAISSVVGPGLSSVCEGVRLSIVSGGREKGKIGTRRSRKKHANFAGILTPLKEAKS